MPVIGSHDRREDTVFVPSKISRVIVLTHERSGLLSHTISSLSITSSYEVCVFDDGSSTDEKMKELERVGDKVVVRRLPKQGLVRSWREVFRGLGGELRAGILKPDDGIVLVEDDLLFEKGWDSVLLDMAGGCADIGFKPGAMTCFRCHSDPQSKIRDLRGVSAYQSMCHGFQINMVPAFIFGRDDFLDEAVKKSESGGHGLDVWFVGGLSDSLGLVNFMSERSYVAHIGAGRSVAESFGYVPFSGVGYGLSPVMLRQAMEVSMGSQ